MIGKDQKNHIGEESFMKTIIKEERNSSIEALKIVAIAIIVTGHVAQTLGSYPTQPLSFPVDYVIDMNHITYDVSEIVLIFFRNFGALGNLLFFISSAWFLCDSKKVNKKKICYMLSDVWMISVVMMLSYFLAGVDRGGGINDAVPSADDI